MIVKQIRFRNVATGKHWIGIAIAANWQDMFWQVDEHGDPWECEFATITNGSIMVGRVTDRDDGFESEGGELSESIAMDESVENEKLWKTIDWNKKIGTLYGSRRAI